MAALEKTKMVAIVDDDDLMRSALQGLLKAVGLPAQAFASAEEFLKSGQHRQAGCLIADIRMPGMSGLELQAQLNAEACRIPIIFITAHGDEKMRMQALRAGAVEFMAKPFNDEVLLESVRAALESGAGSGDMHSGPLGDRYMGAVATLGPLDLDRAIRRFEQIIGNSPALESVLQQVEQVAPTDSTVLIQGETGTGKELIARAVHNLSERCGRPFIKLNCAAIPFD